MRSWEVSARGAHRRIQALMAMGWSQAALAGRLGWRQQNLNRMMRQEAIEPQTHAAIADLYDRLWDRTPPMRTPREREQVTKAKALARARGWVGPLSWDDIDRDRKPVAMRKKFKRGVDEIAIELALNGQRVHLSPEEHRRAVERGHARRWSDALIAQRLRMDPRQVLRIREGLGLPGIAYGESVKRGDAA